MADSRTRAGALARRLLTDEERDQLASITINDAGHGYDPFGLHPDFVALGLALTRPLYRHYFRVQTSGHENLPREGAAIVAANHSGTLPIDGAMLWRDLVMSLGRVPRPVADYFVPTVPFAGTLFARSGMVGGSRGNVRALLEAGELLMIFPEGVPGIAKHFRERYRLQEWRVGHAEMAIRYRAAVIPAAIIGAEEQMPLIGRLTRPGRWLGFPYLPVTLTPIPLPVRYHIHYGEPMLLHRNHRPEDADDPQVVHEAAGRVRDAVQALIEKGLAERKGIFR